MRRLFFPTSVLSCCMTTDLVALGGEDNSGTALDLMQCFDFPKSGMEH